MNYLTATPNVSASCPPGTCALADGSCWPCLPNQAGAPLAVPTLSEWALMVLFAVLALTGAWRTR
ncbi:MAG: IPTL-CTERM sorting domain-containing protein [Elusimicrobia bacterium]|nr:IPTL-CTERM sorting domain-containing protein [Elusimicrobiota bacterium]